MEIDPAEKQKGELVDQTTRIHRKPKPVWVARDNRPVPAAL